MEKNKDYETEFFGKVPPQAIELEEVIIGSLLLETDAIYKVITILQPEHFYNSNLAVIYATIKKMYQSAVPIDVATVAISLGDQLETIGGKYRLIQLISRIASTQNIEYHATIIYQYWIAREIIRIAIKTQESAFDTTEDIADIIDNMQAEISSITTSERYEPVPVKLAVSKFLDYIAPCDEQRIKGVPTNFADYDRRTNGLAGQSELIIIAGETSQGKTSLALNLIKNTVIDQNDSAAIFSLEMTSNQLIARLVAMQTGAPTNNFMTSNCSHEMFAEINSNILGLIDSKLFIDDKTTQLEQICNKMKILYNKYGVKRFYVDYLQLVQTTDGKENREQQVGKIARRFKNVAKEMEGSDIILLSQLSRDKNNPMPTLSRLRDSGQIEEAADQVIFIYRPEYYRKFGSYKSDFFEDEFCNINIENKAMIIVAKGRNIGTFRFIVDFNHSIMLLKDSMPDEKPYKPLFESESRELF